MGGPNNEDYNILGLHWGPPFWESTIYRNATGESL